MLVYAEFDRRKIIILAVTHGITDEMDGALGLEFLLFWAFQNCVRRWAGFNFFLSKENCFFEQTTGCTHYNPCQEK